MKPSERLKAYHDCLVAFVNAEYPMDLCDAQQAAIDLINREPIRKRGRKMKHKAFYEQLAKMNVGETIKGKWFKDTTHLSGVLCAYYKKHKGVKYISRQLMDEIIIARVE